MAKVSKSEFKMGATIPVTSLKTGMVVRVHQKIKDLNAKGEEKERIQVFEGTVLRAKKLSSSDGSFVVRKVSDGVGVERGFPSQLPTIEKIEYVKKIRVRRAKAFYLRDVRKNLKIVG